MNYRFSGMLAVILISTPPLLPAATTIAVRPSCSDPRIPLLPREPHIYSTQNCKRALTSLLFLGGLYAFMVRTGSIDNSYVSKSHTENLSANCPRNFFERLQLSADQCNAFGCKQGFLVSDICKSHDSDIPRIKHQLRSLCHGNASIEIIDTAVGVCIGKSPPLCTPAEEAIQHLNTTCNPLSVRDRLTQALIKFKSKRANRY